MLFYRLVDQAAHVQPVQTRQLKGDTESAPGE